MQSSRSLDVLMKYATFYSLKGVLLYGPPGTGKTLLARAIASNIDANFLKVCFFLMFSNHFRHARYMFNWCVLLKQIVSSAIIDKYIGESARLIREMFSYAREHQVSSFCFVTVYLISFKWSIHLGTYS